MKFNRLQVYPYYYIYFTSYNGENKDAFRDAQKHHECMYKHDL